MRQKFGASDVVWAGKTVFHCHFLDHEDQGMIAAIKIDPGPADHNAQMTNSYYGALKIRLVTSSRPENVFFLNNPNLGCDYFRK
jgi:hypothetical protein